MVHRASAYKDRRLPPTYAELISILVFLALELALLLR
jgi:hypothetical protein